jgi:hypothetical protein
VPAGRGEEDGEAFGRGLEAFVADGPGEEDGEADGFGEAATERTATSDSPESLVVTPDDAKATAERPHRAASVVATSALGVLRGMWEAFSGSDGPLVRRRSS